MAIFLLIIPHKFGHEGIDLMCGKAVRIEVGDGLAGGESLGENNALRYVGLKDGRVQRQQSFADITSNNSIYDFTINHYCGFKVFLEDARPR